MTILRRFLLPGLGLATTAWAAGASEQMLISGDCKTAIQMYQEQIKKSDPALRSVLQLKLAIAYLHDQEQERAFRAFLDALEVVTDSIPKQPEKWAFGQRESSRDSLGIWTQLRQSNPGALAQPKCPLFRLFGYRYQMTANEEQLYSEALKLYLSHTGRLAQKGSAQILQKYRDVVRQHAEYHQLGYLVALSLANSGQYEEFFRLFFASYQAMPDHYLAYKTRALLSLKLRERARSPEQGMAEERDIFRYAAEALKRNPRDVSLYQMSLQFAPPQEKKLLVSSYLNNMIHDNIIVPRGDLLFFVKEATDLGESDLAARFVRQAQIWYPESRIVDAAMEYVQAQSREGNRER